MLKFARKTDRFYHYKGESWYDASWLERTYSDGDPDINYEKRFVFEYTLGNAKDLWNIVRYGICIIIHDELPLLKPKQWLFPEAFVWIIDDIKELIVAAYFIYIRGIKVGCDCDMNGRYGYDFDSGRPLYYVIARGGGYY
jgi:hypothetical protein